MKTSQKKRIVRKLARDGFVTRNECLNQHITRLSAFILALKKEGYKFRAEKTKKDYKYHLLEAPQNSLCNPRKVEPVYENGVIIKYREI